MEKGYNIRSFRTDDEIDHKIEIIRKVEESKIFVENSGQILTFGETMRRIINQQYEKIEEGDK